MAKTEAALAEALAARGVTTATRLSEEDSGLAEASLSKGPRLDQEGFVRRQAAHVAASGPPPARDATLTLTTCRRPL